jgi:hypothetical protein
MPEIDYVLYDTAPFNVTAGVPFTLFQVVQNGDAIHIEDYTNMLGSGSLPQSYSFRIKSVQVFPAEDITVTDLQALLKGSYLVIVVGDTEYVQAPLHLLCAPGGIQDGAGAAVSFSGLPLVLDNPIEIPGGTRFSVLIYQKTALAAATDVKVCLVGTLVKP